MPYHQPFQHMSCFVACTALCHCSRKVVGKNTQDDQSLIVLSCPMGCKPSNGNLVISATTLLTLKAIALGICLALMLHVSLPQIRFQTPLLRRPLNAKSMEFFASGTTFKGILFSPTFTVTPLSVKYLPDPSVSVDVYSFIAG
jgi:hypothetical protein